VESKKENKGTVMAQQYKDAVQKKRVKEKELKKKSIEVKERAE